MDLKIIQGFMLDHITLYVELALGFLYQSSCVALL